MFLRELSAGIEPSTGSHERNLLSGVSREKSGNQGSEAESLREAIHKGEFEFGITLSYSVYKYDVLMQEPSKYKKYVFDEIATRWGNMLFNGATTFWETDLGADDFDNAGSLCHGWSAVPIYLYFKYFQE